jgi:6-phospho-beta-glucosidase
MKLTVIGTGVRTPLLMSALARRQSTIDLQEVMLVDLDERKLELIGPLCRYVVETVGGEFRLRWTTDSREALTGAEAVIVTIRAGSEQARVLDERIALEHGVLGQETTGPGGFAMALRSIPAVARYARQMRELCPAAWLLNFTNPAGLVAQGLTAQFPDLKIVGICDSPIGLQREVAAAFGQSAGEVPIRFFGLNHLSWMAEARVDGENVVPRLIQDEQLAAQVPHLSLFEPALLRLVGMLPNEYLYYYYYRERALANIQAAEETRGEQVRRLSTELFRDLDEIGPASHPERAWMRYRRYLQSRHGSYMATETGGSMQRDSNQEREDQVEPSTEGGEGYAGVALDILAAAGAPAEIGRGNPAAAAPSLVANVPNRGAVEGMRDDDVVEVVCRCDSAGLHPLPAGEVPEDALLLMQQVKRYERLTVEAVQTRSRELAIEALMAHPLVGSYPVARSLVNAYLDAHHELVGEWPREL